MNKPPSRGPIQNAGHQMSGRDFRTMQYLGAAFGGGHGGGQNRGDPRDRARDARQGQNQNNALRNPYASMFGGNQMPFGYQQWGPMGGGQGRGFSGGGMYANALMSYLPMLQQQLAPPPPSRGNRPDFQGRGQPQQSLRDTPGLPDDWLHGFDGQQRYQMNGFIRIPVK
jgi:hypothetical protein